MLNLENQILIFESYLTTNRKKNANDNIKKSNRPNRPEITNLLRVSYKKFAYKKFEMTTQLCIVDGLLKNIKSELK